jgi:cell division protein FtsB
MRLRRGGGGRSAPAKRPRRATATRRAARTGSARTGTPGAPGTGAGRTGTPGTGTARTGAGRTGASRTGAPGSGSRARAAAPRRTESPPVVSHRRGGLTVRAAVLAVAVATVVLALALPFKVWLAQRGDIARLEQQTREQRARVAALQAQHDRWKDPAYVKAQARERLHMVMPGETAYIVLGGPPPQPAATSSTQQQAAPANLPWYSALWRTVQVAGTTTKPAATTKPAGTTTRR